MKILYPRLVFSVLILLSCVCLSQPNTGESIHGRLSGLKVSGLSYQSGELSGVTTADGLYEYQPGEKISFFIGQTELKTTDAAPTISLIEFNPTFHHFNQVEADILRFLYLVDDDEDPLNGVQIPADTALKLAHIDTIRFGRPSFSQSMDKLINAIANQTGKNRELMTLDSTREVITNQRACALSGIYHGNYSGAFSGQVTMYVAPYHFEKKRPGEIGGVAISDAQDPFLFALGQFLEFGPTVPVNLNLLKNTGVFKGEFNDNFEIENGQWRFLERFSGTYEAARAGTSPLSTYRITGAILRTDFNFVSGIYSLDILPDNTVIGFYLDSDLFEGLTKKGPLRPVWGNLSGQLKDGEITASDGQVSLTIPINTHKVLTKVSGFGANGSKTREFHGGLCRL